MKNGGLILATALGLSCSFIAAPSAVKAEIAERVPVPEHVYVEAERQVTLFVNWARNGDTHHDRDLDSQDARR